MYVLRQPDEQLRPFIEHFWFVIDSAGEDVDLEVEVFVDARADLIFNFGAPYRREVIGGPVAEIADSNLDAQRLVPIRITQRGTVRVLGVRFQLGGVAPFSRAHLADLSGTTAPVTSVFGTEAVRLEAELDEERDLDAAAALLDRFFLGRLASFGPNRAFEQALAVLRETDGQASLADVVDAAGVSVRHVQRLFLQRLGFPPRTVARVLRFQAALNGLMTEPATTLGELAAQAGYFDQAHFIRDFRAFTGGVPRGYLGYYPPEGPSDFAPNVVVFIQDQPGHDGAGWSHSFT